MVLSWWRIAFMVLVMGLSYACMGLPQCFHGDFCARVMFVCTSGRGAFARIATHIVEQDNCHKRS